jgi:SAM-dependent methyltransferase
MSEIYNPLRKTFTKNPALAREIFQVINQSNSRQLDDCFIDDLLGLPLLGNSHEYFWAERGRGKIEQLEYQVTSYGAIREVLEWIKPTEKDVIYDLGSGYGRVCLYGALTTEAQYNGIDLVTHRLNRAKKVKKQLMIGNVDFIRSNAIKHDLSNGTVFYLFNPFTPETLTEILNNLQKIAEKHPIRIASYWTWDTEDDDIPSWLKVIEESRNYESLYLLEPK